MSPIEATRVLILLALALGLTGCTAGVASPLDAFNLGPLVQFTRFPGKGSILGETFGDINRPSFTLNEEHAAQGTLNGNRDGEGSVWHNTQLGDITLTPLDTTHDQKGTCRHYSARYLFVGSYVPVPNTINARACLAAGSWWVDARRVYR